MNISDELQLARKLTKTAHTAGRKEMEIYSRDYKISAKADNSPVTEADQAAEDIILENLSQIAPGIPVLAEEAASAGNIPQTGDRFFLVDPLDGTKEFINKNGEFTVNIALIEKGRPVFGIVYAPAISKLYLTLGQKKAAMAELGVTDEKTAFDDLEFTPLQTSPAHKDGLVAIASRSHMNDATKDYLSNFPISSVTSAGSSLKFCLLAEGKADIYPRFGPTMEWDTAAGHAILSAAGGEVVTEDGKPLTYGKSAKGFRNPFFIAWGKRP